VEEGAFWQARFPQPSWITQQAGKLHQWGLMMAAILLFVAKIASL
jgi:hypothetical protein